VNRRTIVLAALLAAGARGASAHEVTIVPSRCALAELALAAVDGSRTAVVSAAGDADVVRLVWDAARDGVQMQARDVPARAFTVDGVAGTLALPVAANGSVTSAGDVLLPGVSLIVSVGGTAVTTRVTLATGLATAGATAVAGAPVDASGALSLVGVIAAGVLPPPLDASAAVVRLGCTAAPVPDLDQLGPAATLAAVGGALGASRGRVRARLVGAAAADALARGPAAIRLDGPGGVLGTIVVAGGLRADGARRLVGDDGSGARVELRRERRGWRLVADVASAGDVRGAVDVDVTATLGDITARGHGRLRGGGIARTTK